MNRKARRAAGVKAKTFPISDANANRLIDADNEVNRLFAAHAAAVGRLTLILEVVCNEQGVTVATNPRVDGEPGAKTLTVDVPR